MSQKTNPLSLRLQKVNRHFSSPWFTDSFFSDTFQYQLMIQRYIDFLLQETQHSIAFFSIKKHYRKQDIVFSVQDIRAEKKEKQLLFNLKSSLSHNKESLDNFLSTKPFSIVSTKQSTNLFRKRIRNDLLNLKLNPIKVSDNRYGLSKAFIATPYLFDLLPLQQKQKIINHFTTYGPSTKDVASFFPTSNAVIIKENYNTSINELFKKHLKPSNIVTYCEKIVKQEKIRFQKQHHFTSTLRFEPIRFVNTVQSVTALLDRIVYLLEKRVSFKDIKAKAFKDVENNGFIKGIRFTCSGRLGGRSKKAQKAKMQSHQWGETTLNAFSSNVVFASKGATTPYGKVGVKIWLSFSS